jgi:hypothetical protein
MKLEAVTVCVQYADFACWTLPLNKTHFDNLIVVTSKEDKLTQRICEYHHIHCVRSDVWKVEGGGFNKAAMINEGLKHLKYNEFISHYDADCVLSPKFRTILEGISPQLDPSFIYSMDRMNCKSWIEWMDFWMNPTLSNENEIFVHAKPFEVATRIARPNGWVPIGYFQMWHSSAGVKYPEEHTTAGRTDMLFAEKFPRSKRAFLPEMFCIHLESEKAAMGANWSGRKTKKFGGELAILKRAAWWSRLYNWFRENVLKIKPKAKSGTDY